MNLLKKIIDLILYSNAWIALGAVAMGLQTQLLLVGRLYWQPLWAVLFFGTLFLYALHRIIGLERVSPFQEEGRYRVIRQFRGHILVYAVLAALAGAWFFFRLDGRVQIALLLPAGISLGYVLPVLGERRRLRDLNHLKIFLISITWAWTTVGLPAISYRWTATLPVALMFAERTLFIFAICLPFDIRDLQVDAYTQVQTLPAHLGIWRTKALCAGLLSLMLLLALANYRLDVYSPGVFMALAASALAAFLLTVFADRIRHDYYFTGLIDGLMILQFFLVYAAAS